MIVLAAAKARVCFLECLALTPGKSHQAMRGGDPEGLGTSTSRSGHARIHGEVLQWSAGSTAAGDY